MENAVNLNINPCKMCVPLGSVTALYGIARCMSILHGSQGCSTYIRRHMATHYNEPVDIASSSLTEEGTVFGGEKNLVTGLENLIRLYEPEVIGVSTTCLAETIGEDVPAIIKKFYEKHPECKAKIIPISSPSYAGTHFDGFFRALRAVVQYADMDTSKNNKINIVTGMISPADTRELKDLLEIMGIDYILLPDLSDNLDGIHVDKYDRLPKGGTPLSEIAKMAGAKYTIELSTFNTEEFSPAVYLNKKYDIPYCRLDLPIGLKATDALVSKLKELGGEVPEKLRAQRGRYLDAMVDSHKYNAIGRAAIFGEPDFVKGMVNLCCENGVIPVLCATGSVCHTFTDVLEKQVKTAADLQFVDKTAIEDDADFTMIENHVVGCGANIMIGSGDGYRIEEKTKVPLIRCTFPIHDRVGGQRVQMMGYAGSMKILDNIANTLLARLETGYRQEIYTKYFHNGTPEKIQENKIVDINKRHVLQEKTLKHPCFTCGSGQYARIHLPIAPKCNIQCNYCVRKYDCPNESRPGVTTEILSPQEAFDKYMLVKKRVPNLTVVGIAGPGDALANFEQTRQTLQMIRQADDKVTFCLSTNGLMLPQYAQDIIDLGVTHVTVTLNAVDPKIGAKIYKHVDYMGMRYTGESAAGILLGNQLNGIRYLTRHGIICKINIVMLKGINEEHIVDIVKKVKDLGCEITNIMQLIPVKGSAFQDMPLVSNKEITQMRKKCGEHMKQMYHCKQCRADAIGTLGNDLSIEYRKCTGTVNDAADKDKMYRFAVATKSGMLVDNHFGHANEFYIYESNGSQVRFIEKRNVEKYCVGKELCDDKMDKIEKIILAIKDCAAVITLRIGTSPQKRLEQEKIDVIVTYDRIENAVKKAALAKKNTGELLDTAL
ncbi:nitrogenase cofactor biosynthesis protein NifB [Pectinatus sottacetonis]|uniref:nitrogenase cofactor biosynthesis protein NifB n=1 Tax=Pectinatus sottacetonis TaxID=1002795 RepID=UPI001E5C79D7|nr:nitrogenase cofactor biosynthesis protein NifB [Pectinatus sottacetonis]